MNKILSVSLDVDSGALVHMVESMSGRHLRSSSHLVGEGVVSSIEGSSLGFDDGDAEGCLVGSFVGSCVGFALGLELGTIVGLSVWQTSSYTHTSPSSNSALQHSSRSS